MAVSSSSELQEQIGRQRPGDKVKIKAMRSSDEKEFTVTLKSITGQTAVVKKEDYGVTGILGAEFATASESELKDAGLKAGVKVNKLKSGKLQTSGIKEGFIITHIDKKPVSKAIDVENMLRNHQGGVLIEGAYTDGTRAYYAIGM